MTAHCADLPQGNAFCFQFQHHTPKRLRRAEQNAAYFSYALVLAAKTEAIVADLELETQRGPSKQDFIQFVQEAERTDEQIRRQIDSMSISADAKALLNNLLQAVTKVGEFTLRIGRKILDFALSAAQAFPELSFAVLIALVFSALFAMVPLLGTLLSAVVTPLALALGIGLGAKAELASGGLNERIKQFAASFAPLKS